MLSYAQQLCYVSYELCEFPIVLLYNLVIPHQDNPILTVLLYDCTLLIVSFFFFLLGKKTVFEGNTYSTISSDT